MIKLLEYLIISTVFLSKGKFEFYLFPYATFKGQNFSVEMWYELNVNQIPLEKKLGYYEGKFDIEILWEDILKGKTYKDKFTKNFRIGNYTDQTKIFDVFILNLEEGEYLIKVKFKTKAREGEVNFKKNLKITYPFISDIFITPSIGKKEDYFFKREHFGFDIRFPFRFSFPDSLFHFFYELYGFEGKEIIRYEVYRDGEKIYSEENKVPGIQRGITSANILLNKLDTGDYTLVISVIKDGNILFNREEKFSYVSFKTIREESIRRYYENYLFFIDYFASSQEIEEFRKIGDFNGKKFFVQKFWKKFDPDLETEANEFVTELIKRIEFSDQNFSLGLKLKGRNTDRGRIFIKYGEPAYVTSSYYPEANRAWESWVYTSPRKIQFIFVDINQDGNYLLTYSSLPEEQPSVADWKKWIPEEIIEVKK
ncbi:MAG: GWxTD domain-containing protein [Candidatus Hydrothermales bacterium]